MRFRRDSDLELCGADVNHEHRLGPFACMRIRGHAGDRVARCDKAALADGVCSDCMEPLGTAHKPDCEAR